MINSVNQEQLDKMKTQIVELKKKLKKMEEQSEEQSSNLEGEVA